MACVGVNSLMRTIEIEFFQSRPRPILQEKKLISFNKHLIKSLHEKLGSVLGELDEKRIDSHGIEATKHLETQLRDVVFRVEDEIEQLVANLYVKRPQEDSDDDDVVPPSLKLHHLLEQAIQDIDAIKEELEKVKMEGKQGRENKDDEQVLMKGNSSQHNAPHSKGIMVGKNNDFHKVMGMLIQSSSEKGLEVVSIKGMGGIGKTTLAKRVYDDPLVRSRFDRQAWAVSSQLHDKRQMLISLLNSMGIKEGDNDKLVEQGDDDDKVAKLASQVQKAFKGQRYLVVMDDVWSGEAWDAIKGCFPNEECGSRILLTTRHTEVVEYTASKNKFCHQMEFLDESESWSLFCEKAGRSCSVEFEMIAAPIVERCKGFPLAIVVVGGLFSRLDRLDEWKNIAESLNSLATTTVEEECSKILSLSYNYLPYNLKACFLYLGVFPEDHEINAHDLARLWFAEGLVKTAEDESFDVVAKRYIQELVDRNLILVSQLSCCTKKIKAFKMHDILHTFCVKEAQNKNLLHVVRSNNNFPEKGFRWLSIQSSIEDLDMETLYSSCSKSVRSIFYFMEYKYNAASLDLDHFNLLRVVYSTKQQLRRNPVHLVHLRYISQAGEEDVNNLEQLWAWNIQTLHIRSDYGRNYLRFPQVHYLKCDKFSGKTYHLPKFANQNLHSISWLSHYQCTQQGFFTRFPSLKAVRIRGGDTGECNGCIDKLVDAPQIETLYIDSNQLQANPRKVPINDHIVLLKRLKKLTIRLVRFEWKGIRALCKLPSLQVLKLKSFGCVGKKWEMEEDEEFCELIYLEIGRTNLVHWNADDSNFPKLEHLRLSFLKALEKIPKDFDQIYTLKSIKLTNCHPSAVTSAQKIKEGKCDFGNDDMTVDVISLPPDEFASNEDALWAYMF